MSLYLDTSIVVPLFVPEVKTRAVLEWIGRQTEALHVAELVITEFHAVVSRLVRSGNLREEQAAEVRGQFDIWRGSVAEPLDNTPADIRLAGHFVQVPLPKLLSADAIHLATSKRCGLTLATDDLALRKIATREGVEVVWVPAPD